MYSAHKTTVTYNLFDHLLNHLHNELTIMTCQLAGDLTCEKLIGSWSVTVQQQSGPKRSETNQEALGLQLYTYFHSNEAVGVDGALEGKLPGEVPGMR